MKIYTVIKTIGAAAKVVPMKSFLEFKEAEEWTRLQMRLLPMKCTYFIAEWELGEETKLIKEIK